MKIFYSVSLKYLTSLTILVFTLFHAIIAQDTSMVISASKLQISSCISDSTTLSAGVVSAYYGDGSDGDLIVYTSTSTAYTDDLRTPANGTNNIGSNSINVVSSNGFSVNDEILIITMQDDNTSSNNSVGTFEFKFITAINGNSFTLNSALLNTYNASSTVKHQVLKVPHYNNVSISSGCTLTCLLYTSPSPRD